MEIAAKRRSRMRRQSTGKRVELTRRDLEIFKLLSRYRFLRSTFIHAFVGGDKTKLVERLGTLYHEGGYLNRPAQQWQAVDARYMPAIYELDDKGEEALTFKGVADEAATRLRRGKLGVHPQFAHSLMICDVLASIELGTRDQSGLRFVTWQEILRHPRCPESTRSAEDPFAICVDNAKIVPDALFGIEYQCGDRKTYRFFALEVDRNTMPLRRSMLRQTSYLKKLIAYREILRRHVYRTQFGLPNLFILNVTVNAQHMKNMMAACKELAADNRFFLFRTMPSLESYEKAPAPTSHMFTQPWERLEHSSFLFDRA